MEAELHRPSPCSRCQIGRRPPGRRAARAALWPYASPDGEIPGAAVRFNGRLIAAVTLVPAVAATLAFWGPWEGSNTTTLFGGWILTVLSCIGVLGFQDEARHFGKAAFLASVVYVGFIVLFVSILLGSMPADY